MRSHLYFIIVWENYYISFPYIPFFVALFIVYDISVLNLNICLRCIVEQLFKYIRTIKILSKLYKVQILKIGRLDSVNKSQIPPHPTCCKPEDILNNNLNFLPNFRYTNTSEI